MPTLTKQPSTSPTNHKAVGSLDHLAYAIKSTGVGTAAEFIVSGGDHAKVIITTDGTARAAVSTNFVRIFGFTYTVKSGGSTSSSFDLTSGTAEDHANRIAQAVLANYELYPLVDVEVLNSGTIWQVQVKMKERRAIVAADDDNYEVFYQTTMTPALNATFTTGGDPNFREKFRFAYQFLQDDDQGGTAVTSLETAPGTVDLDTYQEIPIELDFAEDAARLVSTTPPFTLGNNPNFDTAFIKEVFLRYGYLWLQGTDTFWGSFSQSNTLKVINTALPVGGSLSSHTVHSGNSLVKFLTNRPQYWQVCKEGQKEWLYIILNGVEYYAKIGNPVSYYTVVYRRLDIDGTELGSTSYQLSPAGRAADGILRIPCGPDNMPLNLADGEGYSIQVIAVTASASVFYSEEFFFGLGGDCNCATPYKELYFVEPWGGIGTLPIWRVEAINSTGAFNVHEVRMEDTDPAAAKRQEKGLSTNSAESWEDISIQIRLRSRQDVLEYVKGLAGSVAHWVRKKPEGTEVDETYRFIPEAGSIEVFQHEDYAFASVQGRLNLDNPVQLNP